MDGISHTPFDVDAIRADFPILATEHRGKKLVFLDSGASAQKPRQVIQAMVACMESAYANVHRGAYHLSEQATADYEAARGAVMASGTRLPLPPGTLPSLWRDDARYIDTYLTRYPGYYLTGDGGYIDEDGYLFIMGRVDDIIIVAGHNLSTGSMEQALASHPDVAECAVIGVRDPLKTQVPLGFVVLKAGVSRQHADIVSELVMLVRAQVGPVANFRQAMIVNRLPKTRSGKVLRKTMRSIADGDTWTMPPTIDDPAILDEIAAALAARHASSTPVSPIGG